jgi:S1-C subfamily serine protease
MNAVRCLLLGVALLVPPWAGTARQPTPVPWGFRTAESKPDKDNQTRVMITFVTPGGLADRCGLKRGDTFVSIGKQRIRSADDLKKALSQVKPKGDPVKLTIEVDRAPPTAKGSAKAVENRTWTAVITPSRTDAARFSVTTSPGR